MRDYAELPAILRRCEREEGCRKPPCPMLDDCAGAMSMLRVAADAIEELLAKDTNVPNKWISVKEALPAVNERVLVCVDYGDERDVWDSCRWNGKEWEHEQDEVYDYWTSVDFPVTHWMETPPLPPPPEAVKAQKEARDDA